MPESLINIEHIQATTPVVCPKLKSVKYNKFIDYGHVQCNF